MLTSVFFYFTSSMAQVWAALMVFQILLVRESATRHHETIDQQWKIARKWWGPLINRLASRDPATREKLASYQLNEEVISTAHTDVLSFVQLIKSIRQNQILIKEGVSSGLLNGFNLSPEDWQKFFDPIALKVAQAEEVPSNPLQAFYIGCLGIGGNILGMLSGPLAGGSDSRLWVIVGFLLFGNAILVFKFIQEVRLALS